MSNESVLMQMLGSTMRYTSQRQTVLAHNIANVDTPGFQAQDLKKLDFSQMAAEASNKLPMRVTSAGHNPGINTKPSYYRAEDDRKTFEISPTGNNVDLEDQMAKVSDTGAQSQIAQTIYKKYTGMYRLALGNR